MPIQIHYQFSYLHEKDWVKFTLSLNGQSFLIILPYDDFLILMGQIVSTAKPFFDNIARMRIEGIKQDLKVEFDEASWNKMMKGKDDKT